MILDKDYPTKAAIQAMGMDADSTTTFNNAPYSAKWRVDNFYKNIGGLSGDLEGYTELHFAIKVVPKKQVSSVNFIVYFGGQSDPNGKMQYFPSYQTVPVNTWKFPSILLIWITIK